MKPLASHMTKPFVTFAGIHLRLYGHAARPPNSVITVVTLPEPLRRLWPTAMNPPIMRLAASGMRATASLSDIVFIVRLLTVRSCAATAGSGDQYCPAPVIAMIEGGV